MARRALILAVALFAGRVALAQSSTFVADAAQSKVAFTLGGNFHTVEGTFQVSKGEVTFHPKSPEMAGEIDVAASSGQSGNESRDRRMTKDILEVMRFDVVSFKPQQMLGTVAETGDSTVEISGIFTVHGESHPLKMPVVVHVEDGKCVAKAHFVVPYVQWGMKDPSTFVFRVAKEVTVDLTLVGKIALAQ